MEVSKMEKSIDSIVDNILPQDMLPQKYDQPKQEQNLAYMTMLIEKTYNFLDLLMTNYSLMLNNYKPQLEPQEKQTYKTEKPKYDLKEAYQ